MLFKAITFLAIGLTCVADAKHVRKPLKTKGDVILSNPEKPAPERMQVCGSAGFKCYWVDKAGNIWANDGNYYLEVAATTAVADYDHYKGAEIIKYMTANMPQPLFNVLASVASVGLFTFNDKTTIFPEYQQFRDRPECAGGYCGGACANTCTGDGRKYDDLVGVGGIRGTCMDDNFMCTGNDPYDNLSNILVHEFAHTIHLNAIPQIGDWEDKIYYAWYWAYSYGTWDVYSYAMSNHLEYFAEGATVWFNVNHFGSSGGMDTCGKAAGKCDCPEDARAWLKYRDPALHEILNYVFSNNYEYYPGNLHICMTKPNNVYCDL